MRARSVQENMGVGVGSNKSGKVLSRTIGISANGPQELEEKQVFPDHMSFDLDVINIVHQEENIYLDVTYLNNTADYVPARYAQARDTIVLLKPSDYKMSVVRLDISLRGQGLFRPRRYNFTLTFYYQPEDIRIDVQFMNNFTPTDQIYSFNEFMNNYAGVGMNEAFTQGFNQVVAAYNAIHGAGAWEANPDLAQQAPQVIYDPSTSLFSFLAPENNFDVNPNTGVINDDVLQVYLNDNLQRLFGGGYFYYSPNPYGDALGNSVPGFATSKLYRIAWIVNPLGSNLVQYPAVVSTVIAPQAIYIENKQTYQSVEEWWTGRKLLLCSATLGNRDEYISVSSESGSNVVLPVITDFQVRYNTTDGSPSTTVIYVPNGEYRIIDLLRDQPLTYLDFQFYIQDDLGFVFPIDLFPGTGFSFKILFTKSLAH